MKKSNKKQCNNPKCPDCGQVMLLDTMNTYMCFSCTLDKEEKEALKQVDEEYNHQG